MADPSRSIPLAIVFGCALIAAALFFGLRSQKSANVPPELAPAPHAADLDAIRKAVETQLEADRTRLTARCDALDGGPQPLHWTLDLTFDAQGNQLARGVVEERGASRPEATACLTHELPSLTIPAQGVSGHVEVPLSLP